MRYTHYIFIIVLVFSLVVTGFVGLSPNDSDSDGIPDDKERKLGLDPYDPDSSGDGIGDGYALRKSYLNPYRLNVTVEIDTDTQTDFPEESNLNKIEEDFEDAPVESDTGISGINLTFIKDEKGVASKGTELDKIYSEHTYDKKGVYYLYYTKIKYDRAGLYIRPAETILIQNTTHINEIHTIKHELGHALGIKDDTFVGVDTRKISYKKYESVMNYNSNNYKIDSYKYCSSDCIFNDWEYIEQNIKQSNANGTYTFTNPSMFIKNLTENYFNEYFLLVNEGKIKEIVY